MIPVVVAIIAVLSAPISVTAGTKVVRWFFNFVLAIGAAMLVWSMYVLFIVIPNTMYGPGEADGPAFATGILMLLASYVVFFGSVGSLLVTWRIKSIQKR